MPRNSNEYQREYYRINSVSCQCDCGGTYKTYFKSAHETTQIHRKFIAQKEKPVIDYTCEIIKFIQSLQSKIKVLEEMHA